MTNPINIQEHSPIDEGQLPNDFAQDTLTTNSVAENYCGLFYEWEDNKKVLKSHYYVGACWIGDNTTLVVTPKIKNIDFLSMFAQCFKHPKTVKQLSNNKPVYKIYSNLPKIETGAISSNISLLLIIHFLNTLKPIVKKGIKKGYKQVEKSLTSQVKGKVLLSKTIKNNLLTARQNTTFCKYSIYTIDCIENRLLKKALSIVTTYLKNSPIKSDYNLLNLLNYCVTPFANIDEDITSHEIRSIKRNAVFKEYREAIELAKMIINDISIDIRQGNNPKFTPPFWIDMAALFEIYIYSLLLEKNPNTEAQVSGNYGYVDFITDDIIIDAKYKHKYRGVSDNDNDNEYDYNIDDIRQLAGYARDKKVLKKLNTIDNEPKCLIIYPNKDSASKLPKSILENSDEIEQFTHFYKLGVRLPCL